jgi:Ca-activated chloride channel homolog
MAATVSLRSHTARWILPTALVFCCAGQTALAQTPSAQPNTTGALSRDLTRPQAQPSLTVDRDPILSPDLEEKAPAVTNAPAGTPIPGGTQSGNRTLTKEGNGFVLRADVNEVLLPCTVVDEKGRLVTDLDRGNFQVWEDNVPQKIASFQHRDVPVSLGILVDNSGSMRDKRAAINDAALHLVKVSNPADSAFVVNFSDHAILDQGFTSDISLLEKGLSHIDSRGGTALYDAVVASANEMSRHAKQQKQVLLIITDGGDNASRLTLDQAIRRVQALDGPVVYSIGLLYEDLSKEEAARARQDLESLALQTGGVAYFPRSLNDVNEIAAQVASDIRNQYTLGYHSTKSAELGGYRTVRVEATTGRKNSNLTVRTKKGYYPNQQQQQQQAQTAKAAAQ